MKLIDVIADAPVGKEITRKGRTGTPLWWWCMHVVGNGKADGDGDEAQIARMMLAGRGRQRRRIRWGWEREHPAVVGGAGGA